MERTIISYLKLLGETSRKLKTKNHDPIQHEPPPLTDHVSYPIIVG